MNLEQEARKLVDDSLNACTESAMVDAILALCRRVHDSATPKVGESDRAAAERIICETDIPYVPESDSPEELAPHWEPLVEAIMGLCQRVRNETAPPLESDETEADRTVDGWCRDARSYVNIFLLMEMDDLRRTLKNHITSLLARQREGLLAEFRAANLCDDAGQVDSDTGKGSTACPACLRRLGQPRALPLAEAAHAIASMQKGTFDKFVESVYPQSVTLPRDVVRRVVEAMQAWVSYFERLDLDSEPGDPLIKMRRELHGTRIERCRDAIALLRLHADKGGKEKV